MKLHILVEPRRTPRLAIFHHCIAVFLDRGNKAIFGPGISIFLDTLLKLLGLDDVVELAANVRMNGLIHVDNDALAALLELLQRHRLAVGACFDVQHLDGAPLGHDELVLALEMLNVGT